jgi:acyl-CoA hydrolase
MKKFVSDSLTTMTEMVLPNDTNTLSNLMGGRLLHMMDIVAAIAAQKHSNKVVVTASVDNVSFNEGIPLGTIVTLKAQVTRAFNSSMEVFIEVWADDIPEQKRIATNKAFYTFVAIDKATQKPVPVPEAVPVTEEEVKLYEGALRRRQLRLVLANRLRPSEANELMAFLDKHR